MGEVPGHSHLHSRVPYSAVRHSEHIPSLRRVDTWPEPGSRNCSLVLRPANLGACVTRELWCSCFFFTVDGCHQDGPRWGRRVRTWTVEEEDPSQRLADMGNRGEWVDTVFVSVWCPMPAVSSRHMAWSHDHEWFLFAALARVTGCNARSSRWRGTTRPPCSCLR